MITQSFLRNYNVGKIYEEIEQQKKKIKVKYLRNINKAKIAMRRASCEHRSTPNSPRTCTQNAFNQTRYYHNASIGVSYHQKNQNKREDDDEDKHNGRKRAFIRIQELKIPFQFAHQHTASLLQCLHEAQQTVEQNKSVKSQISAKISRFLKLKEEKTKNQPKRKVQKCRRISINNSSKLQSMSNRLVKGYLKPRSEAPCNMQGIKEWSKDEEQPSFDQGQGMSGIKCAKQDRQKHFSKTGPNFLNAKMRSLLLQKCSPRQALLRRELRDIQNEQI